MLNYYIVLGCLMAMMLLVMTGLIHENSRFSRNDKIKFYLTHVMIFCAFLAEWAGIMLNGAPSWSMNIHRMVKCLDYILTPTVGFLIISQISKRNSVHKVTGVIIALNAFLQIISIKTGWSFYLDAENYYHHGVLYTLYEAFYIVIIVAVFMEFYEYGKVYKQRNHISLIGILLLLMTGIALQEIFSFRVSYLAITMSQALLILHYMEFSLISAGDDLQYHKYLLDQDPLTQLYSRYAYTEDLKKLEKKVLLPENLVVFSVDINELKHVNDQYGHQAGDELIRGAASCVKNILGDFGKCYRTGGDEFIAFLYMEASRAYELKVLLGKYADSWQGKKVKKMSLSIGYAIAKEYKGIRIEKLIGLADEKMYETKVQFYLQEGKDRRKADVKHKEDIEGMQQEYMSIISALSSDITGLYVIHLDTNEVTAYRISASDHRIRSGVPLKQGFDVAMKKFIDHIVHPDDKELMYQSISMEFIKNTLMEKESFTVHFRSFTNGEIHYHYMKCMRNTMEGQFSKIIISFCPEDNVMKMREMEASLDQIEMDELTGLYSKHAFFYYANQMIESNPQASFAVIISDILNFKMYNSMYGESGGDTLLKVMADYLKQYKEHGVFGRYAADQFIAIVKMTEGMDLRLQIQEIQERFNELIKDQITLKFGIYENIDTRMDMARICDRALLALKSIKHNYNQVYEVFDGPVSQQQYRAQLYESRFKQAISNEEFVIWYQPKYNPYTEKIVGAEALVRWKTEHGKIIPPFEFLPVFEKDGLISQLDEYVFRMVCKLQKKWKEKGCPLIPISVNISRNSMHRPDVVKRYKEIVEEYDISPAMVPIEITESAAKGTLEIKPLADAFYEAGFPLHMDDFGSEHSSLTGLNVLHFDVVKLDKSLIDFIGDKQGNIVLMYTIAMGKELGLHLMAEGVETKEQLEYLKDNGCEGVQGYYFSKPLPEKEFEDKVASNIEISQQIFDHQYKMTTASDSIVERAMYRMFSRMPGGFLTYRKDSQEKILSSNQYLWDLFGCDTEAEFMEYVGGSFRGVVCPEDLERVEEYIDHQILCNEDEMDYVEFDIIRKDGRRVPVVDYGHLDHQADGDIFYVFISEKTK